MINNAVKLLFLLFIFNLPLLIADPIANSNENAIYVCYGGEKTGWSAVNSCVDKPNGICIAWQNNSKEGIHVKCTEDE